MKPLKIKTNLRHVPQNKFFGARAWPHKRLKSSPISQTNFKKERKENGRTRWNASSKKKLKRAKRVKTGSTQGKTNRGTGFFLLQYVYDSECHRGRRLILPTPPPKEIPLFSLR
ncbi:hypothetical protein CEXT_437221 [Caerostris extrusa]|uniref:Uncharacterized protein n=1 Tax=Caerostris extrusa TaxID=172846 RepID=A0AAV4RNJ9_CAEEX|nr:hypothetical protein CEXT_437221 [Caerostris extrusa]